MKLLVFLYLFNFLRTLAIIALIYFGIRIITRYVLPLLIAKGVKNMQQKMEDQYRQQNQRPPKQEGEVTIERNRTNQGNIEPDKGEYVDFEEVD
ncbi:MAG: DUF4834 family protein [Prolixibacteraceae bacterium]|nr:DUF4834 family protein [Prolixibacteraceae bacterium]